MDLDTTKLLFIGTPEDKVFLPALKTILSGTPTHVHIGPIGTLAEAKLIAHSKGIKKIFTTSQPLLAKCLTGLWNHPRRQPSIAEFSGSLFHKDEYEILVIDPLEHLVKVPYGKFLTSRYLSKLTRPDKWFSSYSPFSHTVSPTRIPDYWDRAIAIAVDIETFKDPLSIRCIGFTAIFPDTICEGFSLESIVIPLDSLYNLALVRKVCALPPAKIFQNGKYDLAYLARFNILVYNYLWDTATMLHCWYSELPKDLGAISAFLMRDSINWKSMGDSSELATYYEYNARDTYNTAVCFLIWMLEAPEWARRNYEMEFPVNFPCHVSELTGLLVNQERFEKVKEEKEKEIEVKYKQLRTMIAEPAFNTNSSPQVKALLHALGNKDLTSGDAKSLAKAKLRHPLNSWIISKLEDIRKARKLVSTYMDIDKFFFGRILYSLTPHGTDTGRLASKEHAFWCGLNIQNIPRGDSIKQFVEADPGFLFAEADYSQAESRGTAYISGDEALLEAVESDRDFHAHNASAFFAVPYESIVDEKKKVLDKPLRDLAKRVNHGANYNMGWAVLIDTMGEDKVYAAGKILGLRGYSLKQIAEYLLECFIRTYPRIKRDYYNWVKATIKTTHKLAGATGWTRYCFGDPEKSKPHLNAYVAHCPQSLNAMMLNKAFLKVFYEVWLPNHENFKLCCQIHDSILFQYREGHEYLREEVKRCMEFPQEVIDVNGNKRTMVVPVDVSKGAKFWSECK